MVDASAFARGVLDKRRLECYVIETYGRGTYCHICSESERRRPSLGHKGVKTTMVYTPSSTVNQSGFATPSICSQVDMEGLIPIHMKCGDKNGVLSQRLDIAPVTPKAVLYLQASYTAIVAVFGGVMRIDTEMLLSSFDVSEDV